MSQTWHNPQEEDNGALMLQRWRPGDFPQSVVALMQSFAVQIAVEIARLFADMAQKSRELETSTPQFVDNMSHELHTPLAAILGCGELMQEGFYEPQGSKFLDALTRIRSNGKHLPSLINTRARHCQNRVRAFQP